MPQYTVNVSTDALQDLEELSAYYLDLVNEESAVKFEDDASQTINSLANLPNSNPVFNSELNARRVTLKDHKVAIIYITSNAELEVIAIRAFHQLQDPAEYTKDLAERIKNI